MSSVRARICFPPQVTDVFTPFDKFLILIPRKTCPLINDVENFIKNRFSIPKKKHFRLSIDGFMLPSWEKSEIIRENDMISVLEVLKIQSASPQSSGSKRNKKKKRNHESADKPPDLISKSSETESEKKKLKKKAKKDKSENGERRERNVNGNEDLDRSFGNVVAREHEKTTELKEIDREGGSVDMTTVKRTENGFKWALRDTPNERELNDKAEDTTVQDKLAVISHDVENIILDGKGCLKPVGDDVASAQLNAMDAKNEFEDMSPQQKRKRRRRRRKNKNKSEDDVESEQNLTGAGDDIVVNGHSLPAISDSVGNVTKMGFQNIDSDGKCEISGGHLRFDSDNAVSDNDDSIGTSQRSSTGVDADISVDAAVEIQQPHVSLGLPTTGVTDVCHKDEEAHVTIDIEGTNDDLLSKTDVAEQKDCDSIEKAVTDVSYGEEEEEKAVDGEVTGDAPVTDDKKSIPAQKDYGPFPPLEGPPRTGDVIAFKTLELTSTYSPEVSDFKEGIVTNYDHTTQIIHVQLTNVQGTSPEGSDLPPVGKFEMEMDEEWTTESKRKHEACQVDVELNSLIEPKLLS